MRYIVVKCFQYERSSRQSLHFCVRLIKITILYLFPVVSTGFLSIFHGEDTVSLQELRIDCKSPCQASDKRALCSILSASWTTFAVWML